MKLRHIPRKNCVEGWKSPAEDEMLKTAGKEQMQEGPEILLQTNACPALSFHLCATGRASKEAVDISTTQTGREYLGWE